MGGVLEENNGDNDKHRHGVKAAFVRSLRVLNNSVIFIQLLLLLLLSGSRKS